MTENLNSILRWTWSFLIFKDVFKEAQQIVSFIFKKGLFKENLKGRLKSRVRYLRNSHIGLWKSQIVPRTTKVIFDVGQVLYGRGMALMRPYFIASELLLLGLGCSSWAQSGRDIVGGHSAGAAFLMVGEVLGLSGATISAPKVVPTVFPMKAFCHLEAREQLTSRYRPACLAAWEVSSSACLWAARDSLYHKTQEQTIPRRIRLLCRWKGIVRALEKYFSHGDREACKCLFLSFFFFSFPLRHLSCINNGWMSSKLKDLFLVSFLVYNSAFTSAVEMLTLELCIT